jgi:Family of unknown function (DUF6505)
MSATMPLKLLRTIRLDPSDTFVFRRAAEPGEWAVPGSFLFGDADPETLDAKGRAAFRSGFLGIASFGFSTLAIVTQATPEDHEAAVVQLAASLMTHLGAPDMATARAAAQEEIAFVSTLCDHPPQRLIALQRTVEGGVLKERFRSLQPRDKAPEGTYAGSMRAFEFHEIDEDGITEQVDLLSLSTNMSKAS